jgi:hypothetical protein
LTTQNIKEELNKDIEKKNETEILKIKIPLVKQKHKGRPPKKTKTEDRISELKDKIEIKEKNRRNLSQTTQEL